MDAEKFTVLVVDDDPHIRRLIGAALKNSYHILEADSAPEAIQLAETHKPIVSLIDIFLADDTDGKDVCRSIQASDSYQLHPCGFMFLSGNATEQLLLECYELGADDFIEKPFNIQGLRNKVDAMVRNQKTIWSLRDHEEELENLVGDSLCQLSSYGSALNAVKAMNHVDEERQIAKLVFDFYRQNRLNMAIHFSHDSNPCYFDSHLGECPVIQQEVFSLTRHKGRFFSFGERLIVNDQHVSMLFKSAPQQDDPNYGAFIDVVAVLIEAIEARYVAMINERKIKDAQNSISTLVKDVKSTMGLVQKAKQELIDRIVTELGMSFHRLDLTDEQESFFTNLIENAVLAHDAGNEEFFNISDKLEKAQRLLIVEEHNNLKVPKTAVEPEMEEKHEPVLF